MRFLLLLLAFVPPAHAQEIVTLNPRQGVSQSFFIAGMGERKPEAVALLLFVHHREDGCDSTAYDHIPRGVAAFPLVSVKGGKPPESGPCEPFAAHGFYGKEAETVDAIAAWMLKNPYRKEID